MTQRQKTKTKILGDNCGRKKRNRKEGFYWRILNRVIIFLIIAGGISFVLTINDLSIKGFVVRDLKEKTARLENENEDVELKIMELESFEGLSQKVMDMKMVKVDKIDYITVIDEVVVKK